MSFTITTETQTVTKVTDTNGDGFWWVVIRAGKIHGLGFLGSGTMVSPETVAARNSFRQLAGALINNNIGLPDRKLEIDVDNQVERAGVTDQFSQANLPTAELGAILSHFDSTNPAGGGQKVGRVRFLIEIGLFAVVRRAYVEGFLTLPQLADVLIGLGQKTPRPLSRGKMEASLNWLLNNNHINQSQYSNFLSTWDNVVGP